MNEKLLALYQKYKTLFWQIHRFIITGIVNTVFGYIVYACGIMLGLDYTLALILSYIIGVTFSYTTFRYFVFAHQGSKRQSFPKFIATYILIFGFNWAALRFLIIHLQWNDLLAQALIVPCCAAISFIINRLFVFKTK